MSKSARSRQQLIQLIHIGKSQLQMDDDIYRQNLQSWAGKTSCKEMSLPQLEAVLRGLKQLGFKPVAKPGNKKAGKKPLEPATLKKLGQLWTQMAAQGFIKDPSYTALESWAVKQSKHLNYGTPIARLEWMEPIAVELIEQLKNWHRRLMVQALGMPAAGLSYTNVCTLYDYHFGSSEGA